MPTKNQLMEAFILKSSDEIYVTFKLDSENKPKIVILSPIGDWITVPFEHVHTLLTLSRGAPSVSYKDRGFNKEPFLVGYVLHVTKASIPEGFFEKYSNQEQAAKDKIDLEFWDKFFKETTWPQNEEEITSVLYEQIEAVCKLIATGNDIYPSLWNHITEEHDLLIPTAQLNINDMWAWACADCETLEWEYAVMFYDRVMEIRNKVYPVLPVQLDEDGEVITDNRLSDELEMNTLAYCAIRRGSNPENWMTYYKHIPADPGYSAYRPIDNEERIRFEDHKEYWRTRIVPNPYEQE